MKHEIGQKASFSKTISEHDIYGFAGLCGDFNPVHINAIAAKESPFGKRICHGMLAASFISTVLGMYLPGPGTIYLRQSLDFQKPVYIGDTLTATVEITVIHKTKPILTLKTIVVNQNGECVIEGEAVVKAPAEKVGNEKQLPR